MAEPSEEELLQAQIAALSGAINQHKQQQNDPNPQVQYHYHYAPPSRPHRADNRWSPYGRGGRGGFAKPLNRSLHMGGAGGSPPPASAPTFDASDAPLISTRAPGKIQVMTKDTFEREQRQLLQYKQGGRDMINRKERHAVLQHINSLPNSNTGEVTVEGLRFQLRDDGSKLIRFHDATTNHMHTPKIVTLAGVDFSRTKSGNLVLTNAVRGLLQYVPGTQSTSPDATYSLSQFRSTSPPLCEYFAKHGTETPHFTGHRPGPPASSGKCTFGPNCRFSHDPDQVAMCQAFLYKGSCPFGGACDLSHEPSYRRVPACTHFLRGNCINDTCRFPHIRVSESAPVCRSFSTLFYCPLGDECGKRHLFICADHANTGKCDNPKCSLPHPVHAHELRKVAARRAKTGSEDESDVSSDEEHPAAGDSGIDDVDSDAAEEVLMTDAHEQGHALSQQQDFVSFN